MTTSGPENWATSGLDLFLELDRGPHLRARLEAALRDAIRSGRLRRGTRLPSTRALARDLGLSRGTVLEAYAQLAAEGWVAGRTGSSTVVAVEGDQERRAAGLGPASDGVRMRFDLRPGRPDATSFPRADWLRATRRALASAPAGAFAYGAAAGQLALRIEIAGYLARARGLRVGPDDIVVTTGFTQALGLVARAVPSAARPAVAMEEPSLRLHRDIVRASGRPLVLLPVDGEGLRVDLLAADPRIGMVVLTPNRQHPTGVALSAPRRARVVEWARATGATLLEDDYDGEFRYDRRPLGALQALEPDAVVYAGTASKTLAPGLRLAWLVVPARHRAAVIREKELADWHTSTLEQLTLAEFLRSAAYDRHVRRMRLVYRRRRDAVLAALARSLGLEPEATDAGLNVLLPVGDAATEAAVVAAAARRGIALDGLATGGYHEGPGRAALLVGYAAPPEHAFRSAISELVALLAETLS